MSALYRNLSLATLSAQEFGILQTAGEAEPMSSAEVVQTSMAISYSAIWNLIGKLVHPTNRLLALDVCSGSGHFTKGLEKFLRYQKVEGLDRSLSQIAKASHLFVENRNLRFNYGIANDLSRYVNKTFSLTTFINGAHKLDDITDVRKVLTEMDRVTKADGLVVLADSVNSESDLLESVDEQLQEQGLPNYFSDSVENSVDAAWTIEELINSVPESSNRNWYQLSPVGLPHMQIIVGLPQSLSRFSLLRNFGLSTLFKSAFPDRLKAEFSYVKCLSRA